MIKPPTATPIPRPALAPVPRPEEEELGGAGRDDIGEEAPVFEGEEELSAMMIKMVGVIPQPQEVTFAVSSWAVWRMKVRHSDEGP